MADLIPDLAAVPTSTAPMPTMPVDSRCTLGVLFYCFFFPSWACCLSRIYRATPSGVTRNASFARLW